ncbi:MAG: TolC family protein, partial [Sphingobacteriales bacterium]|nr:TolC family protein [Sphingobacteriales bacterium]
YLQYQYVSEKRKLLFHQDSIYQNLDRSSNQRYKAGESTELESVTSAVQAMQIKNAIEQNTADLEISKSQLQLLLHTMDDVIPADTSLTPGNIEIPAIPADSSTISQVPLLAYLQQELKVRERQTALEKSRALPDIILGFNSQTYKGTQFINGVDRTFTGKNRFNFFQVGVGIPIFPGGYKARVNAAKINEQIAHSEVELKRITVQSQLQQLVQQYVKLKRTIEYFQSQALPQSELIIQNSQLGFKSGDISYVQHQQNLTLALNIHKEYLDNLYQYNQSLIFIETLLGKR